MFVDCGGSNFPAPDYDLPITRLKLPLNVRVGRCCRICRDSVRMIFAFLLRHSQLREIRSVNGKPVCNLGANGS